MNWWLVRHQTIRFWTFISTRYYVVPNSPLISGSAEFESEDGKSRSFLPRPNQVHGVF